MIRVMPLSSSLALSFLDEPTLKIARNQRLVSGVIRKPSERIGLFRDLRMGCAEGEIAVPAHVAVVNSERRRTALQKYADLRAEFFPEVPDVSGEDLLQLVLKNAVGDYVILVDCRSELERKVSIYNGAISLAEFEANVDKYKDKQIVAYCAIGRRSGIFLRNLLIKYPGMKVLNHAGGVVDWAHVGGPFVDENTGSPVLRVHPNTTWIPYLPLGKNLEVYGT